MKEPKLKLPWEFDDVLGDIYSPNSNESVAIELYTEDSEYIVQACNNFHRSIELLKKYSGFDEEYSDEIEEFLDSLK